MEPNSTRRSPPPLPSESSRPAKRARSSLEEAVAAAGPSAPPPTRPISPPPPRAYLPHFPRGLAATRPHSSRYQLYRNGPTPRSDYIAYILELENFDDPADDDEWHIFEYHDWDTDVDCKDDDHFSELNLDPESWEEWDQDMIGSGFSQESDTEDEDGSEDSEASEDSGSSEASSEERSVPGKLRPNARPSSRWPSLMSDIPAMPWISVIVDRIDGLPEQKPHGYNSVLIFMDRLSQHVMYEPTFVDDGREGCALPLDFIEDADDNDDITDCYARSQARAFIRRVVAVHGSPYEILINRSMEKDGSLCEDFWTNINASLPHSGASSSFKPVKSTAQHSKLGTNTAIRLSRGSEIEPARYRLEDRIADMLQARRDWTRVLEPVAQEHNGAKNALTRMSPNEVLEGYLPDPSNPRRLNAAVFDEPRISGMIPSLDYESIRGVRLPMAGERRWRKARLNLQSAQYDRMEKVTDLDAIDATERRRQRRKRRREDRY